MVCVPRVRASRVRRAEAATYLLMITLCISLAGCSVGPITIGGPPPSSTVQHVIVLVAGLNTAVNSHCTETTQTFEHTSANEKSIANMLNINTGSQNPYADGCDGQNVSFWSQPASIAQFSYKGGAMDTANRGFWQPNGYGCSDVDNLSLMDDVTTFDTMLKAYQTQYPNATFTLVGHSLGGLVALQAAYDYEIRLKQHVIDRVMTIDSPLNGVSGNALQPIANFIGQLACKSGSVENDLVTLGKAFNNAFDSTTGFSCPKDGSQSMLSECKAQALLAAGVSVDVLGNAQDTLYCDPTAPTPSVGAILNSLNPLNHFTTHQVAQLTLNCATQFLPVTANVFERGYSLTDNEPNAADANHGAILKDAGAQDDIVRAILAPVVTISSPSEGQFLTHNSAGTSLSLSATIRCVFGNAVQSQVTITPTTPIAGPANGKPTTLLTSQGTNSPLISVRKTFTLDPQLEGPSSVTIHAEGNACSFPATVNKALLPTTDDYASTIPVDVVGGLIAVAHGSEVDVEWPVANASPLVTIPTNGEPVEAVAWSPDGTRIAYLALTGVGNSPISSLVQPALATISDLHVVFATGTDDQILTSDFHAAVALTWTQSALAVEEAQESAPDDEGYVDVIYGVVRIDPATGNNEGSTFAARPQAIPPASCEDLCIKDPFPLLTGGQPYRIQVGANGVNLVGHGQAGSMLIAPGGQAQALESTIYGQDDAPGASLNAAGTLAARIDTSNLHLGGGQVPVDTYPVQTSSPVAGSPATIAQVADDGYNATTDFSPDGKHLAVCAGNLYMIDLQSHAISTLLALPGRDLNCFNVRYDPTGQSILVELAGQPSVQEFATTVGLAIVPAGGGQPTILHSCGLSVGNGIVYNGQNADACSDEYYAWEPFPAS